VDSVELIARVEPSLLAQAALVPDFGQFWPRRRERRPRPLDIQKSRRQNPGASPRYRRSGSSYWRIV